MEVIRHKLKLIKGNLICPDCGYQYVFCEYRDCMKLAVYEGWEGEGRRKRRRYCDDHSVLDDLVKACKNFLDLLEGDPTTVDGWKRAVEMIENAVAKAEQEMSDDEC